MPTATPATVQAALVANPLGPTPITGVVGFAVGETGEALPVYVCDFRPDGVDVTLRASSDGGDPPALLISLTREGWGRLASAAPADTPRVINDLSPSISGHLPFFIRHLHSVVGAMVAVAPVLSA